jgi:hypothetical protein
MRALRRFNNLLKEKHYKIRRIREENIVSCPDPVGLIEIIITKIEKQESLTNKFLYWLNGYSSYDNKCNCYIKNCLCENWGK